MGGEGAVWRRPPHRRGVVLLMRRRQAQQWRQPVEAARLSEDPARRHVAEQRAHQLEAIVDDDRA
eukprot:4744345-Prymnesium_polylepis.1